MAIHKNNNLPLVSVQALKKHFPINKHQTVKALNGISFDIHQGETFGLVGESGCGKSTVGRTIMGLYLPTAGQVHINGKDIHQTSVQENRTRRRQVQMIFQDPYASLNPRATIFEIIAEPLEIHQVHKDKNALRQHVYKLLEEVGLNPSHAHRYPHEFSGGQRQRVGIARALALEPEIIIADEPISALDVSIQAQIVLLLQRLQQEKGLTYLFIAHDLAMVKYLSDRVGVMYLGQMAEVAASDELYANPLHPYTQALLSAIPVPDPDLEQKRQRILLKGELPSAINPPTGCVFHTRCPQAQAVCRQQPPVWKEHAPGHFAACHFIAEGNR
ncbi:MAG: ATP-binding cassette domain-containing protein [Alcaligenaceae bacterium]|nr:ATP-binding cassette domain-containing protein [Alcaligenaceae bacterium]